MQQVIDDAEGRAERLTVLLDDVAQTLPMRNRLLQKLNIIRELTPTCQN